MVSKWLNGPSLLPNPEFPENAELIGCVVIASLGAWIPSKKSKCVILGNTVYLINIADTVKHPLAGT